MRTCNTKNRIFTTFFFEILKERQLNPLHFRHDFEMHHLRSLLRSNFDYNFSALRNSEFIDFLWCLHFFPLKSIPISICIQTITVSACFQTTFPKKTPQKNRELIVTPSTNIRPFLSHIQDNWITDSQTMSFFFLGKKLFCLEIKNL